MQIGMIGLGRMGGNMVDRLLAAGHRCVVYDREVAAMAGAAEAGAAGTSSLEELTARLDPPRVVWLMVPAAAVGETLDALLPLLSPEDVIIDGGNSHYARSMRRAEWLTAHGIRFVDVGTSGGVHGRDAGYCQMIGGDSHTIASLAPLFEALANGRRGQAGYLHCGQAGSGHFVKMVHNAIEYGVMQAYAEGFELLLKGAPAPAAAHEPAAPELDPAAIAELWRHGSVIRSWLLDLIAGALADDPGLEAFHGPVSDSGEGRWALERAVEEGVPVPALAAALFARFGSGDGGEFAARLLSAMRHRFGGHGAAGGS